MGRDQDDSGGVSSTSLERNSFTWLNNDREKDRTFALKEYRHAQRLQQS